MKEIKELKELIIELPNIAKNKNEKEAYNILIAQIDKIAEIRKTLSKAEDLQMMKLFRDELLEMIHYSKGAKYIFEKPRGYAGDFMTQEIIYHGVTNPKHRYTGINDIGNMISALSLDIHICIENVNRLLFIKEFLKNGYKKIASIGCGSCLEYWNAKQDGIEGVDAFLLDQDSGALDSAKNQIIPNGNTYNFHCDNIVRFILNKDKMQQIGKRDLVYSLGMFDYFDVKNSKRVIEKIWDSVSPGGLLIYTNAHPEHPNRTWMEYALDWFLCYKTEENMQYISSELPEVESRECKLDKSNVYVYMKVKKKV